MSQKKLKKLRAIEKEKVEAKKESYVCMIKDGFWKIIKDNWVFLLILLVGVVVLYLNAMKGAFVSDDYASITQNSDLLNPRVMLGGFNTMRMGTYFIALLFGQSVLAFHLAGLICYLIFIIISFSFIHRVFGKQLAIITSLFFALHPIHVEAVSWISGRIYIILAIYILLGLMSFIYYLETGKFKFLGWMGLFFTLGFLTDKPRPFSLILLVFLYVYYLGWNKVKDKLEKFIPYVWVFGILFLIIAFPYVKNRIGVVNGGYNFSDSIFYNPLFQYPTGIAKYLQMLWAPFDLTLYHTLYIFSPWLNWLVLLLFLGVIIYFIKKDKRITFALLFMLFALAPSMAPVKVSWLVAERYMFLGSLGFCLFLAILIENINIKVKNLGYFLMIPILCFYGVRVFLRNIDWQTNHNLWVRTVQYSWNSHNAWNNIGDDYDKLAQYENSIKGFRQSYVVKPNYADAYHNQANIFFKIGRYDLARQGYEMALAYSPALYQSYISLTQVALNQKDFEGAFGYANKLLETRPNDAQSYYVMGMVFLQIGREQEGMQYLEKSLQVDPQYRPTLDVLRRIEEFNKQKSQN